MTTGQTTDGAVPGVRPAMTDERLLSKPNVRAAYASMLAEDGHHNLDGYLHAARLLFSGLDLKGRSVLEVGSGEGLMTLYMALSGASVVSMEPELVGSRSGMIDFQRQRLHRLNLQTVEFLSADFNTWDPQGRTFDVVLLCNSINHICESRFHADADPETRRRFVTMVTKIRKVTAPSGVTIASDACRYGFFMAASYLNIPRPWDRRPLTLNWRIHQNPPTWRRIFTEAGFASTRVIYPLPYRLRHLGPLVQNPVSNYFLDASFILHARG